MKTLERIGSYVGIGGGDAVTLPSIIRVMASFGDETANKRGRLVTSSKS
jgi:hypothetical protein